MVGHAFVWGFWRFLGLFGGLGVVFGGLLGVCGGLSLGFGGVWGGCWGLWGCLLGGCCAVWGLAVGSKSEPKIVLKIRFTFLVAFGAYLALLGAIWGTFGHHFGSSSAF